MKTLNKQSSKILDTLVEGLEVGEGRKVKNSETFMPVSVNRLSENLFSVTHYFEQMGDLVPDPDVVFFRFRTENGLGVWAPASYQDQFAYQEALIFENGELSHLRPALVSQLTRFSNMWMKNIKDQQGGIKALRKK